LLLFGEFIIIAASNSGLAKSTSLLRTKATKTAVEAVIIAFLAIILATLLASYAQYRNVAFNNLIDVQASNVALWILDLLPIIFAYVGQYSSYMIANEASLMVMEETKELRSYASQMQMQANLAATHDHLTGLPNQALFYDRIESAFRESSGQSNASFAILLLNIENLKEIQDTLGPTSTDLVIKQMATRLESWATKKHSIARIDSGNFAFLLSDCDKDKAESLAKSLIKAIEPNFIINALKLTLHPSIGISVYPNDGDDADMLFQRAGIAVVFANKSPAGYSLYTTNMDEHSPKRLTMMGELKKALDKRELELYFQPKLNIKSRKLLGVEALMRWKHHEHGFISPEEFIGIAERSRLIIELTAWVIEDAFSACAEFHKMGHDIKISINLSMKDLLNPELPDLVAGLTAKIGIDPSWVIFEITEGSIMTDPTRALIIVERLKSMGFDFSIDDFGTGYSSMAYLKRLPVSELKIDKSFVLDMMTNENDAIIVQATIGLAHNLGLTVTAEGVEDEKALQMLDKMGCDIAQGYFFSRPLPKTELLSWMQKNSLSS
jgi:diguanylate cyclase (GGDEF)-like protein